MMEGKFLTRRDSSQRAASKDLGVFNWFVGSGWSSPMASNMSEEDVINCTISHEIHQYVFSFVYILVLLVSVCESLTSENFKNVQTSEVRLRKPKVILCHCSHDSSSKALCREQLDQTPDANLWSSLLQLLYSLSPAKEWWAFILWTHQRKMFAVNKFYILYCC